MKDFDVNAMARMITEGLEEALKVQERKTVPRQTNMPDGTNPSCQTNMSPRTSEGTKRAEADDDIYICLWVSRYTTLWTGGSWICQKSATRYIWLWLPLWG